MRKNDEGERWTVSDEREDQEKDKRERERERNNEIC